MFSFCLDNYHYNERFFRSLGPWMILKGSRFPLDMLTFPSPIISIDCIEHNLSRCWPRSSLLCMSQYLTWVSQLAQQEGCVSVLAIKKTSWSHRRVSHIKRVSTHGKPFFTLLLQAAAIPVTNVTYSIV